MAIGGQRMDRGTSAISLGTASPPACQKMRIAATAATAIDSALTSTPP